MLKKILALVLIISTSVEILCAQISTQTELKTTSQTGGDLHKGYYYIAKPFEVTMTINLWGEIPAQGVYVVSTTTDIIQLLSYAGGPKENADLDEILLYRTLQSGKGKVLRKINIHNIH